jgi:hypothetical protein
MLDHCRQLSHRQVSGEHSPGLSAQGEEQRLNFPSLPFRGRCGNHQALFPELGAKLLDQLDQLFWWQFFILCRGERAKMNISPRI